MEAYKSLRKALAVLTLLSLPYVCNDGCAAFPHKAYASEIQARVQSQNQDSKLEVEVNNR